jgi:hypothetical protein
MQGVSDPKGFWHIRLLRCIAGVRATRATKRARVTNPSGLARFVERYASYKIKHNALDALDLFFALPCRLSS